MGLDPAMRLLAIGISTSGSPEESHREPMKGSKGERQIAWTYLMAEKGSGPVFRRICVQGMDASHICLTDNL
jgi:hypothetical protein